MSVRPAKTQISLGIRPIWSESSLCAQWVVKDPSFLHADSEDFNQTGQKPRLIWVFAGRTCHFVMCLHFLLMSFGDCDVWLWLFLGIFKGIFLLKCIRVPVPFLTQWTSKAPGTGQVNPFAMVPRIYRNSCTVLVVTGPGWQGLTIIPVGKISGYITTLPDPNAFRYLVR